MPKKTSLLILILAIVTGILLFLAISQSRKQNTLTGTPIPTKVPIVKTAKVFFSPQNLDLSQGSATSAPTVDLIVDTGGDEIAGVQVELQYDPKALTNVRLIPAAGEAGFFGPSAVILFNDVVAASGRASYAVAISTGQPSRKGVGKIATLSFQKAFGTNINVTAVAFLDKTLVTKLNTEESVLKETMPLNIVLSTAPSQRYTPSVIPSVGITR